MTKDSEHIALYFQMRRIRAVEEAIAARYPEGKMRCPVHLSIGQEAVSAAAGLALRPTDYAVSGHRAHGHYLGKGASLPRMLAEIYGKVTGCSRGKGGSMHLIDESVGFMGSTAIVGGTIPVGVGLGFAAQLKNDGRISAVFLGDGAIEEGVFFESANFAALKKLPVLFICENNLYSVYSHLRVRQPENRKIFELARAIGLESSFVDGNDAVATLEHLQELQARVRGGSGPHFVECFNYRWREHCGPHFDNHIGYRSEEEFREWQGRDSLPQLEKSLRSRALLDDQKLSGMDAKIALEIKEAFAFAESSAFPDDNEIMKDTFR